LVLFLAPHLSYASQGSDIASEKQRLLEVFNYILNHHVTKPEAGKVVDNAIKGILDGLGDPYNGYFSATEYRQLMEYLSGSVTGIGIYIE